MCDEHVQRAGAVAQEVMHAPAELADSVKLSVASAAVAAILAILFRFACH